MLARAEMREAQVDAAKVVGQIRSFQGVNCGPAPLVPGKTADATAQYKDLRIGIVRTHDFFGPTDVDAQWPDPDPIARAVRATGENSIFGDWNADPDDEKSHHFGPSDRVITAIVESGAEVYYRLGRSWSADSAPTPCNNRRGSRLSGRSFRARGTARKFTPPVTGLTAGPRYMRS